MEKFNFLLFFLLINMIYTNLVSNKSPKTNLNILRKLWEEDMEIPSGRAKEEESSLNHCAKSSYKYFSFILSGAPVTFSHTLYEGGSVR